MALAAELYLKINKKKKIIESKKYFTCYLTYKSNNDYCV